MALPRRSARWLLSGAVLIVALLAGARLVDSPAARVAVARVKVGALESWISTNGVIEPREPHVIRAPVATFLKTVDVVEGQTVRRGVTLMTLDLAEQRAEVIERRRPVEDERIVRGVGGAHVEIGVLLERGDDHPVEREDREHDEEQDGGAMHENRERAPGGRDGGGH